MLLIAGTVCIQDHILHARLHVVAWGGSAVQVETEHGGYCPHVARGLHYQEVCGWRGAQVGNWKNSSTIDVVLLIFSVFTSVFLGNIKAAYDKNPELSNLLLDDFFKNAIHECQDSWRKVLSAAALLGIPTPAFSTALTFYDGYRSGWLPANLIQVSYLF